MPTLEKLNEQILEQLELFNNSLHQLIAGRPPIFSVEQLSSTRPYIIDYKERKHVYIWLPSSSLALSFAITSGTTPMYIKCTDEVIA